MDDPRQAQATDEELFTIIDETGEGWGFDLEPSVVAKPLAAVSGALFGFGMLAGIPAGIALGRAQDPSESGKKTRPTAGGAFMAFRAFVYGTMLCGAMGAAGAYAAAWYFDAWTWKDFGIAMRGVAPGVQRDIESAVNPVLNPIRRGASEGLPAPAAEARDRFGESRIGKYIKQQIELATQDPGPEPDADEKPADSNSERGGGDDQP